MAKSRPAQPAPAERARRSKTANRLSRAAAKRPRAEVPESEREAGTEPPQYPASVRKSRIHLRLPSRAILIRERLRTGIPGCHARSSPCRRRNPHFLIRERLQAGIPECRTRSSSCRKRNPHFLIRERLRTGIPECRARSSLSCHSAPGRARPPGRAVRWRARRSGPASDRSARPAAHP